MKLVRKIDGQVHRVPREVRNQTIYKLVLFFFEGKMAGALPLHYRLGLYKRKTHWRKRGRKHKKNEKAVTPGAACTWMFQLMFCYIQPDQVQIIDKTTNNRGWTRGLVCEDASVPSAKYAPIF